MSSGAQNLAALEAKASTGAVEAQFELAVVLDRLGRRAEARSWLERAASAGHPPALNLAAMADLQGLEVPRNIPQAIERLRRSVASGSSAARRILAAQTAIGTLDEADWPGGMSLLIAAGQARDPIALRELALLVEMASPGSALAEDLLLRAGLMGDGLAAFAILRRQASGRVLAAEEYCSQWRAGIARFNHPLAASVANVAPIVSEIAPKLPHGELDWQQIEALLATPPGIAASTGVALSERPLLRRFDGLLSAEECDYLIGSVARLMRPAEVVDHENRRTVKSRARTNSVGVLWPVNQDMVIHAINLRLAAVAGLAPENGEMTNILMYRHGEQYLPHYDFFPVEAARADPSGQRIRTLLVYLNTDYVGGDTKFLTAGIMVKGNVGDAILFHNCDAAGGPDKSSLHAGQPVLGGQKWLLSKWYRETRFVPWGPG